MSVAGCLQMHGGGMRDWLDAHDLRTAWAECPRGDWMLSLAISAGVDQRLIVRAAGTCAHLALSAVPTDELRPLRCLRVLEAWVDGNADAEMVREAKLEAERARISFAMAPARNPAAALACAAVVCAASLVRPLALRDQLATADGVTSGAWAAFGDPQNPARAAVKAECARIIRCLIPIEAVEAAMEANP